MAGETGKAKKSQQEQLQAQEGSEATVRLTKRGRKSRPLHSLSGERGTSHFLEALMLSIALVPAVIL